jgi:hypothetical protein
VFLESAWNELATCEAGVSYKSEERFLAAPAETVKLFAEKNQPDAGETRLLDLNRVSEVIWSSRLAPSENGLRARRTLLYGD